MIMHFAELPNNTKVSKLSNHKRDQSLSCKHNNRLGYI